jgi:hypothetical protein
MAVCRFISVVVRVPMVSVVCHMRVLVLMRIVVAVLMVMAAIRVLVMLRRVFVVIVGVVLMHQSFVMGVHNRRGSGR